MIPGTRLISRGDAVLNFFTPLYDDAALQEAIITAYGFDLATANTEFQYAEETRLGQPSQVWVRTAGGWRIAFAHVSFIEGGA